MSHLLTPGLDPTPARPERALELPANVLHMRVDVHVAHLANPLVATSRLLASEAGALTRVLGDEERFDVLVALPGGSDGTTEEAWVRWAVHNAGVRGTVDRLA